MSEKEIEYRQELKDKSLLPSWYYEHKGDNIVEFGKELIQIVKRICKNHKGFMNRIKMIIDEVFHNHKFQYKDIDVDTTKREGYENARDKRNKRENNSLTYYRNLQRKLYENKLGEFSREQIILFAQKMLLKQQTSVEYIVMSGYSSLIGFIGTNLANLDNEIYKFITNPFIYGFVKISEYTCSFSQGYTTRFLVDQIVNIIGLSEIGDNLTDEIISKYISPFVGTIVGFTIGCIKYLFTWNKKRRK